LRAPTPTGAAELAVPSLVELITDNKQYQERLLRSINQLFKFNKNKLIDLQQSYVFKNPKQLFLNKEQELDQITDKLTNNYQKHLTDKQNNYSRLIQNLKHQHPETKLVNAKEKINRLSEMN